MSRDHGSVQIPSRLRGLFRVVMERRRPDLLSNLSGDGEFTIAMNDRSLVQDALGDELFENGIDREGVTDCGKEIEELILLFVTITD